MRAVVIGTDFLALGTIVGAATHVLPDIAGVLACIWYVTQIFESRTYRHWRERHKQEPPDDSLS